LQAVISNASSFIAGAAKQKGIDYTSYLDFGLSEWVLGDAHRLQQILVNLLSNAVKFTEKGEVHLRVARRGDVIQFSVADTGIGMNAEQLSRLFVSFEQADASTTRNYGGTGLGLAISRNLANLMGGEISVDSAPGRGSTFNLRLPLPATEPPVSEPVEAMAAAGHRLQGLRVLAAEDVEVNQLILEDLLAHEGARVVFAGNGLEALTRLEAEGATAFDVVLMDVQMPVMDGYEATRRIRELEPQLPVIGLTAHAVAEEREKGHGAGMLEHVTKPIDIEELVSAILRHVTPKSPVADQSGQAAISPVAAAQNSGNGRLIDWAILLERFHGNREFIRKLAALSFETYAGSPANLRQLAQTGDVQALAFQAHRLKGSAGNLLAHELHTLASEAEDAARAGLAEAFSLALELADAVERVLAELEDYLRQAGGAECPPPG
jgi:CheY-like chemotaxis protein/HPt (histidine-containing phosphotransfer) domain-containing protein/anti-sigma regulatory factor (Ser/Thr protein kinase)